MTTPYRALIALASDTLTEAELDKYRQLFAEEPFDYSKLIDFDRSIGGPGFTNVSCNGTGRYHVEDRDIFRPLQYCSMYFKMSYEGSDAHWLTRTLVQMSSLHIEGLVKSMVGGSMQPLGRVLRLPVVRQSLDPVTWSRIDQFTHIYNEAKHTLSHPKDTHLFSMEDALLAYVIARKLAIALYPITRLHTDLKVFSEECSH
jgi:hypothetical protein